MAVGVGLGQPGCEGGADVGEELGVLCALGIVELAFEEEVVGILGGGGAVRSACGGAVVGTLACGVMWLLAAQSSAAGLGSAAPVLLPHIAGASECCRLR